MQQQQQQQSGLVCLGETWRRDNAAMFCQTAVIQLHAVQLATVATRKVAVYGPAVAVQCSIIIRVWLAVTTHRVTTAPSAQWRRSSTSLTDRQLQSGTLIGPSITQFATIERFRDKIRSDGFIYAYYWSNSIEKRLYCSEALALSDLCRPKTPLESASSSQSIS